MTQPDVSSGPCIVCGDEAPQGAAAICNGCGEIYHLVLTQNGEGKDCGEVWLNEEVLALEFACANCIAAQGRQPAGEQQPPGRPTTGGGELKGPAPRIKHEGLSARDIVRRKRR